MPADHGLQDAAREGMRWRRFVPSDHSPGGSGAPPVAGIYIKVGTAWMRSRRARPILAAGLLQPTTQQPAKLGHHAAGMFILPQASNDRVHSAGLLPYDCLFRTTVLQFAGAKIAASAAIRFKRSQT